MKTVNQCSCMKKETVGTIINKCACGSKLFYYLEKTIAEAFIKDDVLVVEKPDVENVEFEKVVCQKCDREYKFENFEEVIQN